MPCFAPEELELPAAARRFSARAHKLPASPPVSLLVSLLVSPP
jgi:hypothetical protein